MKIACITPDRKQDYLVSTVLEGLVDLGVELVVSDPGNGIVTDKMSDQEFVVRANQCDAVLAFFGKVRGNSPPRYHLMDEVKLPRSKKVYVDGSEWRSDGWDTPRQVVDSLDDPRKRRGEPWIDEQMWESCGHYFKRECWPEDITQYDLKPFPFALCKRHILPPTSKDIDIFCSFGHTKTGLRKEAIETCERWKRETNFNVVIKSGLTQAEYKDTLARSKIVVDAWGGGDTTDRFWEGVGAGAVVLYQRHNVITPNPFVDWEHAVSWATESELSSCLNRLMHDAGLELDKIGQNGLAHALRFHTARHRAEEIICVIKG